MLNCIDNHCSNIFLGDWCTVYNKRISASEVKGNCLYYKTSKTCNRCKHANVQEYKSDTIDMNEYRCPYMNDEIIFTDYAIGVTHDGDFPECKCEKWEKKDGDR